MKFILSAIIILLVEVTALCNSNDWINEIKKEDPSVQFISEKSTVDVSFEMNKETALVSVLIKQTHAFKTITPNATVDHTIHYSNRVSIVKMKAKNEFNQKTKSFIKTCGNRSSDGTFYSDAKFCNYAKSYTKSGEVFNFYAETKFKDIRFFTRYFLTKDFPIYELEMIINIPSWLELDIKEFNFENLSVEKSEVMIDGVNQVKLKALKVRSVEKKFDTVAPAYLYPHLVFIPKSYDLENNKTTLLSNTQDLYEFYQSLSKDIGNKPDSIRVLVQDIIKDSSSDSVKVKLIYEWVRDNIKYIAFENGLAAFKPESAQSVYFKKYGDCKGMANLLKEMLTLAEFDARLTWLGTKSLPYDHSIPSLCVDNHMICTLFQDGKTLPLDATDKYSAFGITPQGIRGKETLIENGDTFIKHLIEEEVQVTDITSVSYQLKLDREQLSGSGILKYEGYSNNKLLNLRDQVNLTKEKSMKLFKSLVINDLVGIDDITLSSDPKPIIDQDFEMPFTLRTNQLVTSFDDDLYVNIEVSDLLQFSNIEKDRKAPVDLKNRQLKKLDIQLAFPNGFDLSHSPNNVKIDNKLVSVDLYLTIKPNQIELYGTFETKTNVIDMVDFETWNSSIDTITTFFNDQIVLSKTP